MVRLNRNKLSQDQLEGLFQQFNKTLGKLSDQKTGYFISELLGKEERIMLAKRLAIIILLLEKKSLYRIGDILKISPTTAEKIKYKLDTGEFENIIKILGKDKKEYLSILETLDSILHLGGILPHYNGLDRYKGI
jgi:uncharacterized protein YerC